MIVERSNVLSVINKIGIAKNIALDTETSGLNPYGKDKLFSIIITADNETFYFNFNNQPDHSGAIPLLKYQLDRSIIPKLISKDFTGTIFMHNAKFDMAFLYVENLDLTGHDIHDTAIAHRVLHNNAPSLKLGDITGDKLDTVDKYITKNKLYTWITVPYKKNREKEKHYNLVPLYLILEYGEQDAKITYELGMSQVKKLEEKPDLLKLFKTEKQVTKILFNMEKTGIKCDLDYITKAMEHYDYQLQYLKTRYNELTGYNDPEARKEVIKAFEAKGYTLPLTEKRQKSLTAKILTTFKGELPSVVKEYRSLKKTLSSYFAAYAKLNVDGIIHTSFNQSGTTTGRMSCRNPNMQQLRKDKND